MSLENVGTSLAGFVRLHNNLSLHENSNVVIRKDNEATCLKVKLISGGGSGHEPAHIGYIGHGMLTAAVCGDVFTSPTVAAILDCILHTGSSEANILLIVKNYTGDRLNFGMATEKALSKHGYKNIKILLVDDDCSIKDEDVSKSVGKRGLAGVVLIHKILGAMAEQNCSLEDIFSMGRSLLENNQLCTVGFTFVSNEGGLKDIEIGKGIHGEPGVTTMEAEHNFDNIIDVLLTKIGTKISSAGDVVLLLNNLGGTSEFLMSLFADSLIRRVEIVHRLERVYCGTFLSSLKQEGISVTVLNLGDKKAEMLEYLNYSVRVPCPLFSDALLQAIPSVVVNTSQGLRDKEDIRISPGYANGSLGIQLTENIIAFASEALISCKAMLNMVDSECGDGDTGTTIAKGCEALLAALNNQMINLKHPTQTLQQISDILQENMGGTSGALYSIFFLAASRAFISDIPKEVALQHWCDALTLGNNAIMQHALTNINDRTMLDPLKQGEVKLKESIDKQRTVLESIEQFTMACEETARKTKDMIPKSGRASYGSAEMKNKSFKQPDSGAHAVSIWARAMLEACKQILHT